MLDTRHLVLLQPKCGSNPIAPRRDAIMLLAAGRPAASAPTASESAHAEALFLISAAASKNLDHYWRLCATAFCFAVFGLCGLLFGLIVFALVVLITKKTWFGLQMRAVTQNRAMAASMGIRTARIDALTFGLGSGIAGIAGVALSQIDNVSPNLGQGYIVDSFMVVVFGGVGNLWGTLVGAFTLGIANKFLEPYAGAVLGKIAILVLIILFIQKRPRGLFALKGRAVEA